MPELRSDLEPMYSEKQAAIKLGIKKRSLMTERVAGRIKSKKVAGKIFYLHSALVEWQQRDNHSCQEKVPDPGSYSSKRLDGLGASTTSDGRKMDVHASVRRAKQTSNALKRSSRTGSSLEAKKPSSTAPVVPLK